MTNISRFGTWAKDHVDLALILAAATEIPRWTVAFLAIHEPLWVGVPLGALLAWALKDGWNGYFRTKRLGLLALNLAALTTAICVITPVLYAMTYVPVEEVNLTMVFGDKMAYRMAWAGLLALSTFLPLIQLSAVRSIESMADNDEIPLTPKVTKRHPESDKTSPSDKTKRTPKAPVITEKDTEALLADVDMVEDKTPDKMADFWKMAYSQCGRKGEADNLTAMQFGKKPRTIARHRESWQMA